MGLEQDIRDLLYCHDCVIVPQWGGFLTHYRSARLDEARQLVHPPGKDVSFNRHLDRNDGLLADHLAKREGGSYNDARISIEETVKQWRAALESKGRLEIPHIGIFYRDQEKNLQFEPDRTTNFLKDAHGLRPVAAIPAPAERVPVVRVLPQRPLVAPTTNGARTGIMWAAAATAAVIFGAAAFWAYRMGDTANAQWSGLDPFARTVQRTHEPATAAPAPVLTPDRFSLPKEELGVREVPLLRDGSRMLTVDLGTPTPVAVDSTAVVLPKKEAASGIRARFHIIGGCFAQEENADRFLQELRSKGFEAKKLSRHGDLHPVAFGSYTRRKEALEAMANVKQQGTYSAWLLVR